MGRATIELRGEVITIKPAKVKVGGRRPTKKFGGAVLTHEAGHAVVAHALGLKVVNIEPFGDGMRTGFEMHGRRRTRSEHFMLAVVSLAGGAAQLRVGVNPDDDPGCAEDLDLAVGHVLAYLGEDPKAWGGAACLPPEVDPAMKRAGALAQDIVKARWPTVRAIARALTKAERLDEAELGKILEAASG